MVSEPNEVNYSHNFVATAVAMEFSLSPNQNCPALDYRKKPDQPLFSSLAKAASNFR